MFVSIVVLVQDAYCSVTVAFDKLNEKFLDQFCLYIMQCKHSFEYSEACDGHAYFMTCYYYI